MPHINGAKSGGRGKGVKNKGQDDFLVNLQLAAKSIGKDFDPFVELMTLYYQAKESGALEIAVPHLFKMLEYMFAKKRSVEVTGKGGEPIEFAAQDLATKFNTLAGVAVAAALLEDGSVDKFEASKIIEGEVVHHDG